jgi:hypothetical protein
LDATTISEADDDFFTVTDGRTGVQKDICGRCSRSVFVPPWTSLAPKELGDRVKPSAHTTTDFPFAYDVVTGGTTGATEPVWPEIANATVTDGDVVWVTRLGPLANALVYIAIPGQPEAYTSTWGWMTGNHEPGSA